MKTRVGGKLLVLWLAMFTAAPLASAEVRTWKDVTGKFSVEAELVSTTDAAVVLKTSAGRTMTVPLAKLSAADRAFLRSQAEKPARPAPPPRPKPTARTTRLAVGERQIREVLKQPTSFDFKEAQLMDVCGFLRSKHRLQIVTDRRALQDLGFDVTTKVTAQVTNKPLGEALAMMLGPNRLTAMIRNDVLWITSLEESQNHARPRVYRVTQRLSGDLLVKDITTKVEPQSWSSVGGPNDLMFLGRVLVVRAGENVHQKLTKDYAQVLRLLELPAARKKPVDKIQAAMAEPTTLEFIETPLTDAAAYLADLHQVSVEIDKPALEESGFQPELPISAVLQGISLQNGLEIILHPYDLTWTLSEKGILITTPEVAEENLIEKVVPAADIIRITGGVEALNETITTLVAPSTWDEVGGPAKVTSDKRANLTIKQTPQLHQQIDELFRTLRQ